MSDFNNVHYVKEFLDTRGLTKFVYDSFDKAKSSGEVVSVVLFEEGNRYELHVVGVDKGDFVEYASWVYQEIEEDDYLAENIWFAVADVLSQPDGKDKVDKARGEYGWYKTSI